ncbi:MAG: hypothetical protein GQ572_01200 [Gammaproteobacteria bacterium]|nr:hypothetical protein [Gammaproteobacteria bacterium]
MMHFTNSIIRIFLILTPLFIAACGGGGNDGPIDTVRQGLFIDSPVEGITYKTATQSGRTDSAGTFSYKDGETITFSLGEIILGDAMARATITPIDLVQGAVDEMHPTVTNICRFLQSLDLDNNLDNGIEISQEIIDWIQGQNIDFTKSVQEFGLLSSVTGLFDSLNNAGVFSDGNLRGLRNAIQAQAHIRESIAGEPSGEQIEISWLREGNFWKVAWHEVETNIGWTGGYGDYDLGSYTMKIGAPQLVAGIQMYELILSGDTQKYTPLWQYIGTDNLGNVYGLSSIDATPTLIFSKVDDTWTGIGFYTDFEGETGIQVNRNGYMAPSKYTKQSGYAGTLTSVGWSKNNVVYSGSGCEYFSGYGTICGSTGTGAGPDVDNEMHFEYWSPTAGPVGMHLAYNYENCLGFYCNEKHLEQRIEIWHFGDVTGSVDFLYESEPDTYVDPTMIQLGDIIGQVFSVYGDVYTGDLPSGVIESYSAVVSDELMAQIESWYPHSATEGQDIAERVHDWYKFEISEADVERDIAFYLVWNEEETNLNFYFFTAPDNPTYGFLYLGQETFLDTVTEFNRSKGIDGTLAAGTYLLGVERTTPSDFATEYGILVLRAVP